MQAGGRARRQPAWHMLASEFSEATLNEKGSGEYDPSFVITKLGAKVNRVIVAGLLERLEVRETSNGSTLYQGQMRDPSGVHYFSVGDYASESMRELTLKLVEKTEVGEPVLLLMTAKSRWYQTDEGAVYTSLRPEEACEIDAKTYALWLTQSLRGNASTHEDTHSDSLTAEPTAKKASEQQAFRINMVEGLLLSRNHYGDVRHREPTRSTSCRRWTLPRGEWKQPASRLHRHNRHWMMHLLLQAPPMTMLSKTHS